MMPSAIHFGCAKATGHVHRMLQGIVVRIHEICFCHVIPSSSKPWTLTSAFVAISDKAWNGDWCITADPTHVTPPPFLFDVTNISWNFKLQIPILGAKLSSLENSPCPIPIVHLPMGVIHRRLRLMSWHLETGQVDRSIGEEFLKKIYTHLTSGRIYRIFTIDNILMYWTIIWCEVIWVL